MTRREYTPEQLKKLAQIPNIERRLAEEQEARRWIDETVQRREAAMAAIERLIEKARGVALPELRTAGEQATPMHLRPMNDFFTTGGAKLLRLAEIPEAEHTHPTAFRVSLELRVMCQEWCAAVTELRDAAEAEAAARADRELLAAPLEAEIERELGRLN